MENPLSEEQIIELNEIIKLPKEEQQVRLQSFLSTLSQEQIEFLKQSQQSQQSQCLFCSIVNWEIPQYRIYEDSFFIATLDINPATKGHVIIIPKKHSRFINEVEGDYTKPIKKIVNKLFEIFQCDTSIVINNGDKAGQKLPHVSIHIIPRYENDKVNIAWDSEKGNEEELKQLSQKLKIENEVKDIPEKVEEIKEYYEEERIA